MTDYIYMPIKDVTFSVVDTETTGMNPRVNRVMDVAIVKVRNGEIIDKWEALVDPQQEISSWITLYTKLTQKDVVGKPVFKQYAREINKMLSGTVFVGHNVNFDYLFLKEEMRKCDYDFSFPKLCTVMLGRKLLPKLSRFHLDALSDYYNIKISQRHRAMPDASATAILLKEFIDLAREKYYVRNFFDLERLQYINVDKAFLRDDAFPLDLILPLTGGKTA